MAIDLNAYLNRIQYTGDTRPKLETLRALHRAHMMHVPFENLDIHVGRWIELNEEKLFHKIVGERRGGFCFEQNGLFHRILTDMGYAVYRVGARVHRGDGTYGIADGHMALIVTLDETRWLVDVGFGDSFTQPLELAHQRIQTIDGHNFRVEIQPGFVNYSRETQTDVWEIQYQFTLNARPLSHFEEACHYMQTSPQTHFTQKRICSKVTPYGRLTLSDQTLIETRDGQRQKRQLASEAAVDDVLLRHFGIDLTPARQNANRR